MTDTSGLAAALAHRYAIEQELGHGGMATVYAAMDLRHQRRVAIKVLRAELSAALGAERFLREVTTTANLRHPHILPLYDSGEANGRLFYVMPYIEGETLRHRLEREKQLPLDEALQITREVADALGYAHSHGVIHRDIKPANILLDSGHAVVADFGVARALDDARGESLTLTGVSVGTPLYMSPEQAAGAQALDGRSDLYSLGCVLYEMLAGQPPFTAPTAEGVVHQHLVAEARPITQLRSGVPPAVAQAVTLLLAKTPADRPRTAGSLVDMLKSGALVAAASPPAAERSIAVLAFANMSADPENEFLADGIAEEIINALTKLPGLRVAARTSAFSFKGKNEDLRVIGEKLGVTSVLEGSVRKAGNRLRITAQLINVADGYHVWSERYDRELSDVFAIQDEIAAAVAERLKLTLAGRQQGLVRAGTQRVDAYELYVKGRSYLYRRGPYIARARDCFEQALTLDPDYALAHAGLADSLNYLAMWGVHRSVDVIPFAKAATVRALELAPDLAEAHYALACHAHYEDYDEDTAGREFARAVELSPGYIQARCGRALYHLAFWRGDLDAAAAESARAVRDDPLSAYAATIHAVILSLAKRPEALAEARRATELDPESIVAWWHLQCILGWGGDHAGAVQAGETALRLSSRFAWQAGTLAAQYGRAGDHAKAEGLYRELAARAAAGYVQPTILAVAAIGCGRDEEALSLVARGIEERDWVAPNFARRWPDLDPLRAQPGFHQILQRMTRA
jgi:TolB-like protein/tRNA A-37 threonylcarbamoyl transferase component Bud32